LNNCQIKRAKFLNQRQGNTLSAGSAVRQFAGLDRRAFIKTESGMLDGYIKNRAIIARVINGDEIFNICKVPAATSVSSRLLASATTTTTTTTTTMTPPRLISRAWRDINERAAGREKYRRPGKEREGGGERSKEIA